MGTGCMTRIPSQILINPTRVVIARSGFGLNLTNYAFRFHSLNTAFCWHTENWPIQRQSPKIGLEFCGQYGAYWYHEWLRAFTLSGIHCLSEGEGVDRDASTELIQTGSRIDVERGETAIFSDGRTTTRVTAEYGSSESLPAVGESTTDTATTVGCSQSRATAEKPISSIACIYSVLFLLMAWRGTYLHRSLPRLFL